MIENEQSFPGAFCEPCNKWREPNTLMPDGSCPKCRTSLDPDAADSSDPGGADQAQSVKIPWHFWVMVAATCLYLGWRVVQGLQTLI